MRGISRLPVGREASVGARQDCSTPAWATQLPHPMHIPELTICFGLSAICRRFDPPLSGGRPISVSSLIIKLLTVATLCPAILLFVYGPTINHRGDMVV